MELPWKPRSATDLEKVMRNINFRHIQQNTSTVAS